MSALGYARTYSMPFSFKPILHFAQGVPMLFGMLILIPQPRLPPRWLLLPFAQHRIERNPSIPRYPGDETSQPERDASECVVESTTMIPPGRANAAMRAKMRVGSACWCRTPDA